MRKRTQGHDVGANVQMEDIGRARGVHGEDTGGREDAGCAQDLASVRRTRCGYGPDTRKARGVREEEAGRRENPGYAGASTSRRKTGCGRKRGLRRGRMWARRGSHRETQAGRRERRDAGETDAGPGNRDTG